MKYHRPEKTIQAVRVAEPLERSLEKLRGIIPPNYNARIMYSHSQAQHYIRVYWGADKSFPAFAGSYIVLDGDALVKWPAMLFDAVHDVDGNLAEC